MSLVALMKEYSNRADTDQIRTIRHFEKLLETCQNPYIRSNYPGHLTGSAVIISKGSHICLLFHKKLEKWLQPGGHADGDTDLLQVALREAEEETGLRGFDFPKGSAIFDLDIHTIPENAKERKHQHYDVRFLMNANHNDSLVISNESSDLKWWSIAQATELISEPSMLRLFTKIKAFQRELPNTFLDTSYSHSQSPIP